MKFYCLQKQELEIWLCNVAKKPSGYLWKKNERSSSFGRFEITLNSSQRAELYLPSLAGLHSSNLACWSPLLVLIPPVTTK